MSVSLFFCEPESAPYCDLNQPLGALEEASIKPGNKEYDCFHGTNACVSPRALYVLQPEPLTLLCRVCHWCILYLHFGFFWGQLGPRRWQLPAPACQGLPSPTALLCPAPAPKKPLAFAIPLGIRQAIAQEQWDARDFLILFLAKHEGALLCDKDSRNCFKMCLTWSTWLVQFR